MSDEEYEFLAHIPVGDPAVEAFNRISIALDAPVTAGPDGSPCVQADGLLIYGSEVDEEERSLARALGVEANLTLTFVDLSHGRGEMLIRVVQNMMRVVLLFAEMSGTSAVLTQDYTEDAIVLRIRDGELTLNQGWEGWELWPEVLAIIPAPRRMERVRGDG